MISSQITFGQLTREGNIITVGYDYDLLPLNLTLLGDPAAANIYKQMISAADQAGTGAKYYINGKATGTRYRPRESSINLEAALLFVKYHKKEIMNIIDTPPCPRSGRRNFLKNVAVISSSLMIPSQSLIADIPNKSQENDAEYPLGLWDDGFRIGRVRTDFNDPTKGTKDNPITLTPCQFDEQDPLLIPAGASWERNECKLTPTAYAQSNSYTNAPFWPKDNFWVLSINNEPAYTTQFNSGPPDQSLPISKPGRGAIGLTIKRHEATSSYKAIIDLDHGFVEEEAEGYIPFLGIGADSNRGNGKPITFLNPKSKRVKQKIGFKVTLEAIRNMAPAKTAGMFWFIISAKWDGSHRMIFVPLFYYHGLEKPEDRKAIIHGHWNWNIQESFFHSGGDLIYLMTDALNNNGMPINPILETGKEYTYTMDIQKIFEIASHNSYGISFDVPLPKDKNDIPVTGVHWAVEMTGEDARIAFSLRDMKII